MGSNVSLIPKTMDIIFGNIVAEYVIDFIPFYRPLAYCKKYRVYIRYNQINRSILFMEDLTCTSLSLIVALEDLI